MESLGKISHRHLKKCEYETFSRYLKSRFEYFPDISFIWNQRFTASESTSCKLVQSFYFSTDDNCLPCWSSLLLRVDNRWSLTQHLVFTEMHVLHLVKAKLSFKSFNILRGKKERHRYRNVHFVNWSLFEWSCEITSLSDNITWC